MPISILEAEFDTIVRQAQIRGTIHDNGEFEGVIGFGLDVDQVLAEALQTDAAEEIQAVEPILRFNADLKKTSDGCQQFSVGWGFSGTTGYVVRTTQVD